VQTSAKVSHPVRIQSPDPDPDDFHNLTGTSLLKGTSIVKFSWRSDQFSRKKNPEIWANLWKNAISRNVNHAARVHENNHNKQQKKRRKNQTLHLL